MDPEVVEAFFSQEEAYGEYTLNRMKIMQRPDLTPMEKHHLVIAERNQLPPELRATDEYLEMQAVKASAVVEVVENATSENQLRRELSGFGYNNEQITDIVSGWQNQRQFEDR